MDASRWRFFAILLVTAGLFAALVTLGLVWLGSQMPPRNPPERVATVDFSPSYAQVPWKRRASAPMRAVVLPASVPWTAHPAKPIRGVPVPAAQLPWPTAKPATTSKPVTRPAAKPATTSKPATRPAGSPAP